MDEIFFVDQARLDRLREITAFELGSVRIDHHMVR
jgi:hypothetical protein